jgi:hypothetical protein
MVEIHALWVNPCQEIDVLAGPGSFVRHHTISLARVKTNAMFLSPVDKKNKPPQNRFPCNRKDQKNLQERVVFVRRRPNQPIFRQRDRGEPVQ